MSGFRLLAASSPCLVPVLIACGDSTSPGLSLRIEAYPDAQPFMELAAGTALIKCDLRLEAVAAGRGTATWEDAVFRYYMEPDRSEPIDSSIVPAAEIADAWQQGTIEAGETYEAYWRVIGPAPFTTDIVHRYRTEAGRLGEVVASFDCGPDDQEAPAPAVQRFEVLPPSEPLEPGDIVRVAVEMSSGVGLWTTTLSVSGDCGGRQFVESLRLSMSHTIEVELSPACVLGEPLTFMLDVVDAGMRITHRELETDLIVDDLTPPVVAPTWHLRDQGLEQGRRAWTMFEGEILDVRPNASDAGRVERIFWEIRPAGDQDSLVVLAPYVSEAIPLTMRPEWGEFELRVWARDRAGLLSDTVGSAPGELRVAPTNERSLRVANVPGHVVGMAIDSRRELVYLARRFSGSIAVLSMADLSIVRTIAVPNIVQDLDLVPSGDSLIVVQLGSPALTIIDLTGPEPVESTLPVTSAAVQEIWRARVAANGRVIASARASTGAGRILEVDPATGVGQFRDGVEISGLIPLDRSMDASTIAFSYSRLHLYDAASGTWTVGTTVSANHLPVSIDATGRRLAHAESIFDRSLVRLKVMEWTGGDPKGGVLSADGASLFYDVPWRGILRLDPETGRVIERLVTPATAGYEPSTVKRVSPDGSTLVLVQSGMDQSSVMLLDIREF